MKNSNKKKAVVLLTAAVLLLVMTVGATIAYLADTTDDVVNTFIPGNVPPEIEESFDGNVKSNVTIKNTGNINAYIRAKVVITWQDASGNVYGTMPVAGTDYNITWDTTGAWDRDTTDGFCYHTAPVGSGASTSALIVKCEPLKAAPDTNYKLHVEILAQSIQAEPTSVVADVWGVDVGSGGYISKN